MNPPNSDLKRQEPGSAVSPDESLEHLYQYLLDATERLLAKCAEQNILGPDMRALCFLVIAYRTCFLNEQRATTCLELMGVTPEAIGKGFTVLEEIYHVKFPPKLVDRIALLHRLLPDVPKFLGGES